MKIYFKILLLILFGIGISYAQISVTVGSVTLSQSDTLATIPINVTNFNGIGAISLKFKYTDSVLAWRSAENWNTGNQATNIAYANNGTASLSIFSLSPISIGNSKMVDLKFRFKGGQTNLEFDIASCEISDTLGNVLQATYNNGWVKSQHIITLINNPAFFGTSTGGGTFYYGTVDTIKATPSIGFKFDNWTEGSTVISSEPTYIFTVTTDRTLTANFSMAQYTITTSSNPANGGTTSGAGTFIYGQSDTVKAVANSGYAFVNWTEGQTVVSTSPNYGFPVTADRALVANFTINQPTTFKVSGILTYDNTSNTPITSAKVYLKNATAVVDSAVTDTAGSFTFSSVANGTYTLDASCSKEWAGVNSTDALNIRKYQVGLYILEGLRLKAGDNNGNGSVNSTDALNIRKRLASLITSFAIPDWVFETPSVVVNGADVVQNFKGICVGDVNGSNIPAK